MTAAETSGWSPSATRTASASGPMASNPTCSELDRPRSGSGLTTRRAPPPGDRGLDPLRVVPEDDDRLPHPGLGQGVQDVLEDRPPADRRQQLAATEARPGPGRKDEPDRPVRHIGIFPPPCGQR